MTEVGSLIGTVGPPQSIILRIVLLRLVEIGWGEINARVALRQRGVERGRMQYPAFGVVFGAWYGAMLVSIPPDATVNAWLLVVYCMLQAFRYWCILSLGRHWSTRVIVMPTRSLVRSGPYRLFRHPMYISAITSSVLLPGIFDRWDFSVAILMAATPLFWWRVAVEERALTVAAPDRGHP